MTQINTTLNVDGGTFAGAVSHHQANAADAPATSGSGFDGRHGLIQPAWGW